MSESHVAELRRVLTVCRTALSKAEGALRGVHDAFPSVPLALDYARDCAAAIKRIDEVQP